MIPKKPDQSKRPHFYTDPRDLAFGRFVVAGKRSRKDNWYAFHRGRTVTVFRCEDGGFSWVVVGRGGASTYSPSPFPTEAEAQRALHRHLTREGVEDAD
jgi:hypothetical protein